MSKIIKFFLLISIILQFIYIIENKINFETKYIKNSFTKNFQGDLILPKETVEIKSIVNSNKIDRYNLSNKFKSNVLLNQRTVEYLYPARFDEKSDFFFEIINENNNNCFLLKSYNFIQTSRCKLN
mgnify:FL=1